ncbi:YifB family Mg chelatase-like AAA ATPase [uncultured Maricaulis sp.]|uniref:YifB family Mg chelatase-like AAA ATPase n=1 Tax=uncultured Maricaulis sp. TaxID=174710 RepID=UPI00262CDD9B|nr:YifB family Mg chelatase-like AAA ATPase [uncultured Maricaulis sp.]
MAARTSSVAFQGAEARLVDVQVQVAGGSQPIFSIVGLADKAVAESRERVRAAFSALGLSLPSKRLIVNLAPADQPKEGSHFDLPIAIGVLAELDVLPKDVAEDYLAFGELGADARIRSAPGALPAAVAAHSAGRALICPEGCGPEAAWAGGDLAILAPATLIQLINHFKGSQVLDRPAPGELIEAGPQVDLRQVKGQEGAKRALEIAAAGHHNLLMVGPPGSGKSMLAERLPGLLPPLTAPELLDVSMIHSVAGLLERGRLTRNRPFRAPHHSASMAAMVGGGSRAKPGEASLAHRGVLFLDELPEFHPQVLDSLRQPLETGSITVARANAHIAYPARFQLVAAMNPCRCGGGGSDGASCRRGERCAIDYQARISGPMLDRIDLQIQVPPVTPADLALPPPMEGTAEAAARVAIAREAQTERGSLNAHLPTDQLDHVAAPDRAGENLLQEAAMQQSLTARSYHRILRVARTIADLDGQEAVRRLHIAEALSCRRGLNRGPARGVARAGSPLR